MSRYNLKPLCASKSLVAGMALCLAASVTGCDIRDANDTESAMPADFSCGEALGGWKPAPAVTPDAVPPCMTGSAGLCDPGYHYVSGTGWCRPDKP